MSGHAKNPGTHRTVVRRAGAGQALAAIYSAVILVAGVPAASAHHSFVAHFVPERLVTVEGVVTEFRFRNPHGVLEFVVAAEDGEQLWRAETNSPSVLRRRGWTDQSLAPGDRITVEGYPARDGSHSLRIARIRFADGRELGGQAPASPAPQGATPAAD